MTMGVTNKSQGFSNNIDHMKLPTNQKDENVGEGEALVNKKRPRGVVNRRNGEEWKDVKCDGSDHEGHTWIERERRKKMRNMFDTLHHLLPHIPSKADKSTIVIEAVNHIKSLQQTLEKLEKQKQERIQSASLLGFDQSSVTNSQWPPYDSNGSSNNNLSIAMPTSNPPQLPIAFQTWSTPNLVLNICGDEAQFCIYTTKKPSLLSTIAFVLENHNIDVISATILSEGNGKAYKILIYVKRASQMFQGANSTEESYLQAAGEIAKWVA